MKWLIFIVVLSIIIGCSRNQKQRLYYLDMGAISKATQLDYSDELRMSRDQIKVLRVRFEFVRTSFSKFKNSFEILQRSYFSDRDTKREYDEVVRAYLQLRLSYQKMKDKKWLAHVSVCSEEASFWTDAYREKLRMIDQIYNEISNNCLPLMKQVHQKYY